jgi:hypothetical protein
MKRFISVFLLVGGLVLLFSATRVMAATMEFSGTLTGAEEVPGPGDPDGTGTAMAKADTTKGEMCVTLNVSNITLPAAAAHIHEGASGVAGPVVVPLTAPDANGRSEGCVAVAADLMSRIAANPGNFYFNVHTSDYPAGAVRGQLVAMSSAPLPAAGANDSFVFLVGLALLTLGVGFSLSRTSRRPVR